MRIYNMDEALSLWGIHQSYYQGQLTWFVPLKVMGMTVNWQIEEHNRSIQAFKTLHGIEYACMTLEDSSVLAIYPITFYAGISDEYRPDTSKFPQQGEIWDAMPNTYISDPTKINVNIVKNSSLTLVQKSSVPPDFFEEPNLEVAY